MSWLLEPGLLSSPEVATALAVGGVAATVSAVAGLFTVVRGQSFAGHALTDSAATGGSGAALAGVSALAGFVVGALLGAGAMEAAARRDERHPDLATGVVLGASIGVAALFLSLASTGAGAGSAQQVLFGSMFSLAPGTLTVAAVCGAVGVGLLAVVGRPLLLATVHADLAAARGVPVRAVGATQLAAVALAVGLSSLTVGAILSTALLVGPAATALRLARRPAPAIAWATVLAVGATWLGVVLSYDSVDWTGGNGIPVSACIVGLVLAAHLAVRGVTAARR